MLDDSLEIFSLSGLRRDMTALLDFIRKALQR